MSEIDPQKALVDAMAVVLRDSLTVPMTIEELSRIFGMGFRSMKAHLDNIDVVRAGKMYRIPVRMMPAHWMAKSLPILAESCVVPHFNRDSA